MKTLEVLLSHSFGRTYGYSHQIGGQDAKGAVIGAHEQQGEHGPYSVIFIR
jgi:hypothetical protein